MTVAKARVRRPSVKIIDKPSAKPRSVLASPAPGVKGELNIRPGSARKAVAPVPVISLDASPEHHAGHDHDALFNRFAAHVAASFERSSLNSNVRLFTTDAIGLSALYLRSIPAAHRQSHNCRACRKFIDTYGGLVTIGSDGRIEPALWGFSPADIDPIYQRAVSELYHRVSKSTVTGVFLTTAKSLGAPEADGWTHLEVKVPKSVRFVETLKTAEQAMAERREDFKNVNVALNVFSKPVIEVALNMLRNAQLVNAPKFTALLEWFLARKEEWQRRKTAQNLLWRAIATAPSGFLHIRASALGTLLEDMQNGMTPSVARTRFNATVGSAEFQRKQALPTAGNVAVAEKTIAKLGIERSLHRRFARLEEVPALWKPKALPPQPRSVFGDVPVKGAPKDGQRLGLGDVTMTWEKFARTVLPTAEKIELSVPSSGSFIGLLTAQYADAPPILKWDHPKQRNPLSWFLFHPWSSAAQWGLRSDWTKVNAVVRYPSATGPNAVPYIADGVILILDGAHTCNMSSSGLFPVLLKDDLRPIAATIEAYSKQHPASDRMLGTANGYSFRSTSPAIGRRVRVTSRGIVSTYLIDRWD